MSQANIFSGSTPVSSKNLASANRNPVPCHVCGGGRHRTYLEVRGYRLAECENCGLWYVNPQPTLEELARFYETYDDGDQWRNTEELFNKGVRDIILRFRRQGDVLDIGSGSGNFLCCVRKAGFNVFGIEPSGSGSRYAQAVHGIDTFRGMIEDFLATAPSRRFDIVTLLNVLEHLTDPKGTLLKLRQIMATEGLMVVVVPDARFHASLGYIRRILGFHDPYWLEQPKEFLAGFKFPDHLCSFQPRTISRLLEDCGFAIRWMGNAPVVLNPQFHRNLGKVMMRKTFNLLYRLSFRRVLFGYSTLLVAQNKGF